MRKKTENRRLDYDCKKRKKSQGSAINDEEIAQAAEKFEETKAQTEQSMNRLLQNEVEHISYLVGFAEGFLEYHSQCYEILKDMLKHLNDRKKQIMVNGGGVVMKSGSGAYGASAPAQKQPQGGSEGSSSASRFYDNGGDTSSSLSDNFYGDNHANGKTAAATAAVGFNKGKNSPATSMLLVVKSPIKLSICCSLSLFTLSVFI